MGRHHPVAGAAAAHRRKKVGAWGGRAGAREGRVPTGGRRREGAGSLLRSEPLRGILRSWKAPGVVSYVSDPISREPIRRAASFSRLASDLQRRASQNALPRGAHGRQTGSLKCLSLSSVDWPVRLDAADSRRVMTCGEVGDPLDTTAPRSGGMCGRQPRIQPPPALRAGGRLDPGSDRSPHAPPPPERTTAPLPRPRASFIFRL